MGLCPPSCLPIRDWADTGYALAGLCMRLVELAAMVWKEYANLLQESKQKAGQVLGMGLVKFAARCGRGNTCRI